LIFFILNLTIDVDIFEYFVLFMKNKTIHTEKRKEKPHAALVKSIPQAI